MDVLLRPKMCEITLRGLEGFFALFLPLVVAVVVVSEAVVQGFVNSQRGSEGVCSSGMVFVVGLGLWLWIWMEMIVWIERY